ncbi:endophilin-B2a isoform X7 [Syngnathus acus]|uniref:endophilin-B2a isoform X7 n=1 Tax=Syngnathus acus TaxID=161584 RepID=UPI001885FC89|nr:endophilin-B2a isoform X7 [Syngnathus acus]
MDFNVKRLATGAGLLFTRAVQFTGEKLGQVEKTELDAHYENLMIRADCTKNWTEKIYRQTVVLLQPNPSARIEEFLYEKLDREVPSRVTNGELLGHYMQDAANEFGPDTPYGSSLIKVGECERRLGASEREFLHTSAISFLTPLRNFLEGDWRTISAEHELRVAQTEFDRQAEVTRLLLESISSTHMNHLRCLHEFVEAQATYYKQCHVHMQEVQKELGRRPDAFPLNSTASMASADLTSEGFSSTVETDTLKIEEVQAPAAGTRTAKVLYDYDAADSSELCLKADEIITVYAVPGMDSDWLVGEKGCQKGKVPVTYLELLS